MVNVAGDVQNRHRSPRLCGFLDVINGLMKLPDLTNGLGLLKHGEELGFGVTKNHPASWAICHSYQ